MNMGNILVALYVGDLWLDKFFEVREEILGNLRIIFFHYEAFRPTHDEVSLPCLSSAESESILVRFFPSEVDEVVIEIDGSKSPGPDDFNFAFYNKLWELIKEEVNVMFDQYF